MKKETIDWLLQGEPWVAYRTLTDILGRDENTQEVIAAKKTIHENELIKKIFAEQNQDGYWGKPEDIHTWWPKKNTTFWLVNVLADFGFTKEDKRIEKTCEYVFNTQVATGGFGWSPPNKPYDCHTAILTEALAKLGCLNDPRLERSYEWLVSRPRLDGGFWCKNTGQPNGARQHEPSCALGTMFVLGALAHHPALRNSEVAKQGIEFLLKCWENKGKVKYAGHDSQIGENFEMLKYPFTDYRILKYLDVLSQFDYAKNDVRLIEIFSTLCAKEDIEGRFTPESIHKVWQDFDFGQKEKPSRWITFLVKRIEKRLHE